ncbi:hypothetical protein SFRURICE_013161 [Spodoptera frugiperda]|nr:hypothetical protein SFRURICE_013161 [Spodoptera frugiperda]
MRRGLKASVRLAERAPLRAPSRHSSVNAALFTAPQFMLRCCECVWLAPIIFIGTHSLALLETDPAKLCFIHGKIRAMGGFHTINTWHTRPAHLLRTAILRRRTFIAHFD